MRQFLKKCSGSAVLFPIFSIGALVGLLPLRIWQECLRTDPATGFWGLLDAQSGKWGILQFSESRSIPLLYAGLAVLIVFPALAGFALRKRSVLDLGRRPRKAESIAAILLGAAMVADAATAIRFAVKVYLSLKNGQPIAGMDYAVTSSTGGVLQYYIRTGALAALLETFAGAAGAAFLLQLALQDWFPGRKKDPSHLLALAPLFWVICRILRRFARTISYVRVPDLLLDLLLLACLMIFFLAFAQLLSGIEGEGKASRLLGAGIPAAVLGLLCFVPRIVLRLRSGADPLPQDSLIEWCDPALTVFITIFLAGRFLSAAPQSPEPSAEEPKKLTAE
ncbi:MAG: hypothetical protein LBS96_05385 [Oscillospiraceae bacterium]|jgi:hypothetical protein|nr:hypothetical protein [Oscillospiraceae bacterium]